MENQETIDVSNINKDLHELVNHAGWRHARKMLTEKVLELQNVSEYTDIIQTGNATRLLKEMKANKRAAEILFDWLRQIEGNASVAVDNKPLNVQSHIVRL